MTNYWNNILNFENISNNILNETDTIYEPFEYNEAKFTQIFVEFLDNGNNTDIIKQLHYGICTYYIKYLLDTSKLGHILSIRNLNRNHNFIYEKLLEMVDIMITYSSFSIGERNIANFYKEYYGANLKHILMYNHIDNKTLKYLIEYIILLCYIIPRIVKS